MCGICVPRARGCASWPPRDASGRGLRGWHPAPTSWAALLGEGGVLSDASVAAAVVGISERRG